MCLICAFFCWFWWWNEMKSTHSPNGCFIRRKGRKPTMKWIFFLMIEEKKSQDSTVSFTPSVLYEEKWEKKKGRETSEKLATARFVSRILLIFSLFECLEIQIACISKQRNCVLECVVSIISFLNSFDEWLRLSLLHSLNSRPDKKCKSVYCSLHLCCVLLCFVEFFFFLSLSRFVSSAARF